MKFLLLTQYFPPEIGAAPVRLFEVARSLRARGHRVEIVTAMPNYPYARVFPGYRQALLRRERVSGLPVLRTWIYASGHTGMRGRLLNYLSFSGTCVVGCLLAAKPDVILVESPPLFLGLSAYVASRLRRVPFILNVSDLWPDSAVEMNIVRDGATLRLARRLEAFLYARAHRVNVVTPAMREWLVERKRVPAAKVAWLPNGVDVRRFTATPPDEQAHLSAPVFTYVGSFGLVQDVDLILEAAQLVGEGAQFLLVGEGSEKARLRQRAATLGLTNTRFLHGRPVDEVPAILSRSTAALATVKPGAVFRTVRSAKLFPAMAAARPLIYAGSGDGADLVRQADCGLVVEPGDARAFAEAIRRIIADPAAAQRLGQNGRALVERQYTWDTLVARWLAEIGIEHV